MVREEKVVKLSEFVTKPLGEAIAELNLVDAKIHTDNEGNVEAVELKYEPEHENKAEPRKVGRF